MKIRYRKNTDIDRVRWDKAINAAFNGSIYAYSWYLDIVCEDWEALVLDDYSILMPLPAKKKYGLWYLIQPLFTQQLGIISTAKLNDEIILKFIKAIPKKFRYVLLQLNLFNKIPPQISDNFSKKVTYQLDLIQPYHELYRNYSTNTKRNIKKAENKKITILKTVTIKDLLALKKENNINNLSNDQLITLQKLLVYINKNRAGELYGAYTEQNTLCAAAYFVNNHSTAIYLQAISSDEGKDNYAMFKLVDFFIKEHSEKNITLDFEGSTIEGIARFYKSFGATPYYFPVFRLSKLPFFMRWFKKYK